MASESSQELVSYTGAATSNEEQQHLTEANSPTSQPPFHKQTPSVRFGVPESKDDESERPEAVAINLLEIAARERNETGSVPRKTGVLSAPFHATKSFREVHPYAFAVGNCCEKMGFMSPPSFPFFTMFVLSNIVAGVLTGLPDKDSSAYKFLGDSMIASRTAAGVILCSTAWLLFTVCKHFVSWLRTNQLLNRILPLDSRVFFHQIVGITILLATVVHVVGHYNNIYKVCYRDPAEVYAAFGDKYGISPTSNLNYGFVMFAPIWGWTGHAMLLILIILGVTSIPAVRKYSYELFWYPHHLSVLFFILLCIHGSDAFLAFPKFWGIFIIPGLCFAYEMGRALLATRVPLDTANCSLLHGVIRLVIKRPPGFEFFPGQYALVKVHDVSKLQWHPFSITSSPFNQEYISFHCAIAGDWTTELSQALMASIHRDPDHDDHNQRTEEEKAEFTRTVTSPTFRFQHLSEVPLLMAQVDGAFGSSPQDILKEKHVVMFGAGVGVTPFASLLLFLRDILKGKQQVNHYVEKYGIAVRRIRFIWACKTLQNLEWFIDLLHELDEDESTHPWLHMSFFLTGTKKVDTKAPREESKSSSLPSPKSPHSRAVSLSTLHAQDGSTYTGFAPRRYMHGSAIKHQLLHQQHKKPKSNVRIYHARPAVKTILEDFAAHHTVGMYKGLYNTPRIGLFYCGPPPLGIAIEQTVVELNRETEANLKLSDADQQRKVYVDEEPIVNQAVYVYREERF